MYKPTQIIVEDVTKNALAEPAVKKANVLANLDSLSVMDFVSIQNKIVKIAENVEVNVEKALFAPAESA